MNEIKCPNCDEHHLGAICEYCGYNDPAVNDYFFKSDEEYDTKEWEGDSDYGEEEEEEEDDDWDDDEDLCEYCGEVLDDDGICPNCDEDDDWDDDDD